MSLADLPAHEFERAASLAGLTALLAERTRRNEETILLAGGTDWIVERYIAQATAPGVRLPLVVDISRLEELRGIQVTGEDVRIGAAATYLEIRRHSALSRRVPLLAAMAKDVGAVQIQARGTLGGNLATASPAADGVAALAALDAEIVLQSVRGERRVPLAHFYTGYKKSVRMLDEVIVRMDAHLPRLGAHWVWRKVGTRLAQAISKVALAGIAEVRNGRLIRLGFGMASVAPTTAFLSNVKALALSGPLSSITDAALDSALELDIAPIDDIRSTAAYRRHVAHALLRNFFAELRES